MEINVFYQAIPNQTLQDWPVWIQVSQDVLNQLEREL